MCHLGSEDEDEEEDEEDEGNVKRVGEGKKVKQEKKSDRPQPPVSRDILRLGSGYGASGASMAGSSKSPLALAADVDAFNPDWTLQDLEYTSMEFGKKTASFVCKSILFGH